MEDNMQEKEPIRTQNEAVVPSVVETVNRSTLRPWRTPTLERIPLNEALSGSGQGVDAGLTS